MGTTLEGKIDFSNMSIQSDSGNFSGEREWRRLKFEAGHTYRIKFIDKSVEMRNRHYNPQETKAKGYYRCLGHTGYCPVCVAAANGFGGEGKYKLKKAQEIFGANILVYTTDANGNPVQPLNAEVYFWAFNAKKFVALRNLQQEWGDITQMDLKLVCADAQAAQFQNVDIFNLPQCLYNSDPAFKAQCDAKIEKDKYPLGKMLCKEVDMNEMIKAFGLPQSYLPQGMVAQMPQGQQTVNDLVQGTQPMQGVPVQAAPVQQTPVQQALVQQAPVQMTPVQAQAPQVAAPVSQVQPVVQEQPLMQAAQVQPAVPQVQSVPVQPIPQVAPVQAIPPTAPEDAYSDLDALQNLLG